MPTLTVAQAAQFAGQAGFQGRSLQVIVAIAQAESGLNTAALHPVPSRGNDRGILQINSYYHPEVSDACAFDAGCAFREGFRISKNGTDFTPWTTFQTGAYLRFTSTTPVVNPGPQSGGKPWYEYPLGLLYGQGDAAIGGEHGTDFSVPLDTPITALLSGTITDISSPTWGKQVTWRLDNPWNGIPYAYQIHLDAINPVLKVGSHVNVGDLIGWSGGEISNPGGTAPQGLPHFIDSPSMSGGPHTEFGFSYGPVYGSGPGFANVAAHPELNPLTFIHGVQSGLIPQPQGIGTPDGSPGQQTPGTTSGPPSAFSSAPLALTSANDAFLQGGEYVHQTLQRTPGVFGVISALDEAGQFPGIYNAFEGDNNPLNYPSDAVMSVMGTIWGNWNAFSMRAILVMLGFLLCAGLLLKAAEPFVEAGMTAAKLGALAA